jgi:hypothetical protein
METAMYCILGLLAFLPSYGIGYLINTLSKFWASSILLYGIGMAFLIIRFATSLNTLYWVLLSIIGVAAVASAWTVKKFKQGSYKKFIQSPGTGQQ